MSERKKYYWLKLQKDFFKRHDIRIIESMPNGKDYILFYLKLLLESIDHEGALRFSDTIPYSEDMLSTVTYTNVDIVRSAMRVFCELNMIEILEDETIFMAECSKMLGVAVTDEHMRESTRQRVQAHREKQKLLAESDERYSNVTQDELKRYSNVTCNGEIEKDIEIDIDKDIEIKKENKKKKPKFVPPTLDEVKAYCKERNNNVNPEKWFAYYKSVDWVVGKGKKMADWKSAVITWEEDKPKQTESKPTQTTKKGLNDLTNIMKGRT